MLRPSTPDLEETEDITFPQRCRRKVRRIASSLYRSLLRNKVASTDPSPAADSSVPFSPHMLLCHLNVPMGICAAKSANLATASALPWVFHDDGSLTSRDKAVLRRQFPGCRLIERADSDAYFEAARQTYPALHALRQKHVMLLKLADLFVYSEKDRILYLDSDILFFKKPEFLLASLQGAGRMNYFNRDLESLYIAPPEVLKALTGVRPLDAVNAGFSSLNRKDISLERIERTLRQLDVNQRKDWTHYSHLIEQATVAILTISSPEGAGHFPADYDVSLDKKPDGAVCKHYVGRIRHQFELEGLKFLLDQKSFLERWREFARKR